MPWKPLEDDFPDFPDYSQLGRQLRIASPRFGVYESDDDSYASDEISDLKRDGGLDEKLKLEYDSGFSDDIGIKVRDRQPVIKKRIVSTNTAARKPLTTQRKPLNAAQPKPITTNARKIKLDDIRVDLDLESCLLDE